ncbi:uncharacterized protein LOC111526560 [Piliocolobus tephrosceles]|uniref:uncharacterized protein LOC111526560 n=1 Tax=Piliocolobus tephrosceles TaxID=591936 RepID=UPI000C2AC200|nr:uncharacterized protein LOC111526560 [Piliocolobus tephrosceles]
MTARKGLASSSGGKGKRAAWEGKGRRCGAGARASGEKGVAERWIGRVQEDPSVRPFSRCSASQSPHLAFPLFCPGQEPQTLRHNSPAGAGGEATAKLSANFTVWWDHGYEVGPARGGGVRQTQVARPGPPASAPPASHPASFCRRLHSPASTTSMPRRTPPPVWWGRGGAQGLATRAKIGGGGGRALVPCAEREQFLHVLF